MNKMANRRITAEELAHAYEARLNEKFTERDISVVRPEDALFFDTDENGEFTGQIYRWGITPNPDPEGLVRVFNLGVPAALTEPVENISREGLREVKTSLFEVCSENGVQVYKGGPLGKNYTRDTRERERQGRGKGFHEFDCDPAEGGLVIYLDGVLGSWKPEEGDIKPVDLRSKVNYRRE